VRIYNLGFVIYTAASLLLTIDWLTGTSGALFLIVFRIVQGIGAACLLANSAAIITDAFPANQRGMALGINNIVGVSGMFVGLVLGGLLAPISWRLVFLISVPVGLFGTVWAYLKLQEISTPRRARIDWAGNVSFALGLILIMVAVTYGIRPYGHSPTGALCAASGQPISLVRPWQRNSSPNTTRKTVSAIGQYELSRASRLCVMRRRYVFTAGPRPISSSGRSRCPPCRTRAPTRTACSRRRARHGQRPTGS